MRKLTQPGLMVVAITLAAAGCGGEIRSPAARATQAVAAEAMIASSSMPPCLNQTELAARLAERHAIAIALAAAELERGTHEPTRASAQRLRDHLQSEKEVLERFCHNNASDLPDDPSRPPSAAALQLNKLNEASADNLDQLFRQYIAEHQLQTIAMVNEAMPFVKDSDLRQMLASSLKQQEHELTLLDQ